MSKMPVEATTGDAELKVVMNKRFLGRRVVFALALRRARRPVSSLKPRADVMFAGALAAAYFLHRIGRRSGATFQEVSGELAGDELVAWPMWGSTRGITIDAPVEKVWPWLVQMGFPAQRAGWYTPYAVDRLTFGIRERSADELRPDLQHIEVGDHVPDSADWSVFFTVAEVDPPHALVLHSTRHVIKPIRTIDFSWAFVLRELEGGRTRLLIRARASFTPPWARLFAEFVVGPADFVNVHGMLRGIKRRTERQGAASLVGPGPGPVARA
jgi:hypothetical protein